MRRKCYLFLLFTLMINQATAQSLAFIDDTINDRVFFYASSTTWLILPMTFHLIKSTQLNLFRNFTNKMAIRTMFFIRECHTGFGSLFAMMMRVKKNG
jgi:hypothetical protein